MNDVEKMASKGIDCKCCGMLLEDSSQHACSDDEIPYCTRCVSPQGALLSKDQAKAQLERFYVESLKMGKKEAQKKADSKVAAMFS